MKKNRFVNLIFNGGVIVIDNCPKEVIEDAKMFSLKTLGDWAELKIKTIGDGGHASSSPQ